MDASKILTVVCTLLLLVCLIISILSLTTLKRAIRKSEIQQSTEVSLQAPHDCMTGGTPQSSDQDSSVAPEDTPTQTTAPAESFCLKESNGRIGVFTSDGYLVRFLDVSVDELPSADREALRVGITVGSWRELMAVIQDYTT